MSEAYSTLVEQRRPEYKQCPKNLAARYNELAALGVVDTLIDLADPLFIPRQLASARTTRIKNFLDTQATELFKENTSIHKLIQQLNLKAAEKAEDEDIDEAIAEQAEEEAEDEAAEKTAEQAVKDELEELEKELAGEKAVIDAILKEMNNTAADSENSDEAANEAVARELTTIYDEFEPAIAASIAFAHADRQVAATAKALDVCDKGVFDALKEVMQELELFFADKKDDAATPKPYPAPQSAIDLATAKAAHSAARKTHEDAVEKAQNAQGTLTQSLSLLTTVVKAAMKVKPTAAPINGREPPAASAATGG